MKPYLLVNGNFVRTNGMDMPNLALATYLAERNEEVHLVTHLAEEALASRPNVTVHHVPKPAGSYLLAAPVLDKIGRRWAHKITSRQGRVLVNGGSCRWGDVNWVHYVHAAYRPPRVGSPVRAMKNECSHMTFLRFERAALRQAHIVIANSERTKLDLIEHLRVEPERVHTVYYGIDAEKFHPPTDEERTGARSLLGWSSERPVVAFIGALGDRRKGLDTVFAAWEILCGDPNWDADLAIIGAGAELDLWKARVAQAGLDARFHFMGFRNDVPQILAACDALIAPTRYEAYGQGVHEALCCGLPALVSKSAGVAEHYPGGLQDLLIPDPENVKDIVERLHEWRKNAEAYGAMITSLSEHLRTNTWVQMAQQIVKLIAPD